MVNDFMLDKVLGKIKEITGIEKFDGTKFWLTQMINYLVILLLKMWY